MSRRGVSWPAIVGGCALFLLGGGPPSSARADADYDPAGAGWNGLSGLVQDGRGRGLDVAAPAELDLSSLRPTDGLLVVHPVRPLPIQDLAAFVQAGGRLAVADDFGAAEPLLARFSIARAPVTRSSAPRVRGHEGLQVARTHFRHPLTEGVDFVVTNHPAAVRHPQLAPLVALDREGGGILLTGVVGNGRLVVLSDPSILINQMRSFRGNARLGTNLLDLLAGSPRGRVFVVTGSTRIVGEYEGASGKPFRARLEELLGRIATLELPVDALRVGNAMLAALLLVFAFSASSHESPYRFPFPSPRPQGDRGGLDPSEARRISALLGLYEALASTLARQLSLPRSALLDEATRALVSRGWSKSDAIGVERWLRDLATIDTEWNSGLPTRLGRRRLVSLVGAGERLLARLEKGSAQA